MVIEKPVDKPRYLSLGVSMGRRQTHLVPGPSWGLAGTLPMFVSLNCSWWSYWCVGSWTVSWHVLATCKMEPGIIFPVFFQWWFDEWCWYAVWMITCFLMTKSWTKPATWDPSSCDFFSASHSTCPHQAVIFGPMCGISSMQFLCYFLYLMILGLNLGPKTCIQPGGKGATVCRSCAYPLI